MIHPSYLSSKEGRGWLDYETNMTMLSIMLLMTVDTTVLTVSLHQSLKRKENEGITFSLLGGGNLNFSELPASE